MNQLGRHDYPAGLRKFSSFRIHLLVLALRFDNIISAVALLLLIVVTIPC